MDDRPVQHSKQQDGDTGEDHIVGGSADAVHQSLPTEAVVELVEEQHKGEADVLVEGVLDEAGQAVAGEAAMHQQQAHQEAELPNGIVRVVHSLRQTHSMHSSGGGTPPCCICRATSTRDYAGWIIGMHLTHWPYHGWRCCVCGMVFHSACWRSELG